MGQITKLVTLSRTLSGLAGCGLVVALTGCAGSGLVESAAPVTLTVPKVQGVFMGGQQPVAGVSIQLYAVGTTGYGSVATPLLTPGSVTTTAFGNFTLGSYTCPAPNSQVYLVGTGGYPIAAVGATPAVQNNNLALMAGLGACSTVGSQFIQVNELTTIATVYALSPFMTGIANIGSTPTNATGISNAFASINSLVNTATGAVSGPALPTGATLPVTEINTLADMLEQCINSGGGSASDSTDGVTNGTNCGKLFYLTTVGGTAPTDTITAAMNIAQNPGVNVAQLNLLPLASPVYQPRLSSTPNDWTVGITYTSGNLKTPTGIALDANGNVWLTNSGSGSVSQLSTSGAPQLSGTSTGGTTPGSVAIDQSGNAWIADSAANMVTEISPSGTKLHTLSGNGLNDPTSIAIDVAGNVWVSNGATGSGLSGFTSSGTVMSGSPFTTGGIGPASSIAISPK